ncbi:MAG: GGDEF domain-containing protein [Magnetococcales bacterium]|nr:GGDEF domain-containing protein [Magnetococcales bacterium]
MSEHTTNHPAFCTPETFSEITLFSGVGHESIASILERCTTETIEPGEVLLSPGQDNTAVFVLLEGLLSVHLEGEDGEPFTWIERGGCVGEMSLIEGKQPSASVIAETPSRLLKIDQESLWALITMSHAICRNLLFVLSHRMRASNRVILEGSIKQRLLEQTARTDPLTGLYNRRWLDEVLERQLGRCRQSGKPLGFMLLDVDHFKEYNDNNGHLAGDAALIALGKLLDEHIRPGDVAARYGGEEFGVILPNTPLYQAERIAERLRKAVEVATIRDVDGNPLPRISISIGLSMQEPRATVQDLTMRADAALYEAKKEGRNCLRTAL